MVSASVPSRSKMAALVTAPAEGACLGPAPLFCFTSSDTAGDCGTTTPPGQVQVNAVAVLPPIARAIPDGPWPAVCELLCELQKEMRRPYHGLDCADARLSAVPDVLRRGRGRVRARRAAVDRSARPAPKHRRANRGRTTAGCLRDRRGRDGGQR